MTAIQNDAIIQEEDFKQVYVPLPSETHADSHVSYIPNVFFDEIMPTLPPVAWAILTVFLRKLYGFHKNFDSISITQIAEAANISERTVCRHLPRLQRSGLILQVRQGGRTSAGKKYSSRWCMVAGKRIGFRKKTA